MESDTFLSLIPINPLLHTGCHRDSKLGSNTTIKNSRENNVSRETRQRSMNKSVTFAKIAVPAPAPFLLVAIGKSSSAPNTETKNEKANRGARRRDWKQQNGE